MRRPLQLGRWSARLFFVAVCWWSAAQAVGAKDNIGRRLAGDWTGSIADVRIALEFATDGSATATVTSPEPVFMNGSIAQDSDDADVMVLTLERPGGPMISRCRLRGDGTLVQSLEDGTSVEFKRAATFDWSTWGTYYYLRPRPERFVEAVQTMSSQGVLEKGFDGVPEIGVLLSQLLQQNPSKIQTWMGQVDRKGREKFWESVLWFSRTAEAAEILMKESGNKGRRWSRHYNSGAPVVPKMDPANPAILDMNWGYFMATGDTAAVRNIIRAFNHARYEPAIEAWETSGKTKSDQEHYDKGWAFRAARWSVGANCAQHSRVLAYCDGLLKSGELSKQERATLTDVMSSVDVQMARARLSGRKASEPQP